MSLILDNSSKVSVSVTHKNYEIILNKNSGILFERPRTLDIYADTPLVFKIYCFQTYDRFMVVTDDNKDWHENRSKNVNFKLHWNLKADGWTRFIIFTGDHLSLSHKINRLNCKNYSYMMPKISEAYNTLVSSDNINFYEYECNEGEIVKVNLLLFASHTDLSQSSIKKRLDYIQGSIKVETFKAFYELISGRIDASVLQIPESEKTWFLELFEFRTLKKLLI